MEKIIITQKALEDVDSSPYFDFDYMDGLLITGNDRLKGYIDLDDIGTNLDEMEREFYELCEIVDDIENGRRLDTMSRSEAVKLYYPELADNNELDRLNSLIDYVNRENGCIEFGHGETSGLALLRAKTGHIWDFKYLTGCSQSDWNGCYFDASIHALDIVNTVSMYYFNTGYEYTIDLDGDTFGFYTASDPDNNGSRVKLEALENLGLELTTENFDRCELKVFKGYTKTPVYEIV